MTTDSRNNQHSAQLVPYTFHRAADHAVIASTDAAGLQATAHAVAAAFADETDQTRRAYVHNGRNIVAAGTCRAGIWTDTHRANYLPFADKARAARAAFGITEA